MYGFWLYLSSTSVELDVPRIDKIFSVNHSLSYSQLLLRSFQMHNVMRIVTVRIGLMHGWRVPQHLIQIRSTELHIGSNMILAKRTHWDKLIFGTSMILPTETIGSEM